MWLLGWSAAARSATLYGKKLNDRDVVTKGVRAPAKLLSLLNRYSAKQGTN